MESNKGFEHCSDGANTSAVFDVCYCWGGSGLAEDLEINIIGP